MSTLTKTFVILNLIFSVAFVMVSATVLSQRNHWKEKHAALSVEHKTKVDDLTEDMSKLNENNGNLLADRDKYKALAERHQDQLADRKTEIREKDDTIAELKKKGGELDARLDAVTQKVTRIASDLADTQKSLGIATDQLAKANTELGVRNTTLVGLRAQLAGTELKHKDLLYRHGIMVGRNQDYADLIKDLKARGVDVSRRGGDDDTPVQGPAIRSTVRAVDTALGIVVLGVGSNSEVPPQKGHRFLIYRDRTFVAAVKVTNVDAEMCAARVVPPETEIAIKVGDSAMTK